MFLAVVGAPDLDMYVAGCGSKQRERAQLMRIVAQLVF